MGRFNGVTVRENVPVNEIGLACGPDFLKCLIRQPEPGYPVDDFRHVRAVNGGISVGGREILVADCMLGGRTFPIMVEIVFVCTGAR